MPNENSYIPQFSSHPFWDIDPSHLDIEKSKKAIILRVLDYGLMEDWRLLKELL